MLGRWLRAMMVMLALVAPAAAQESTAPPDWQAVISAQIEALRVHDSAAALSMAAASFRGMFDDPDLFYRAVVGWGYEPVIESRSHAFGESQMVGDDIVLQSVRVMGIDQRVYELVYRLALEPEGWRVSGVQLTKTGAMGV